MNYFVTAIGTDSGKTVVSSILCKALQADYWKPVQAGLPRDSETVSQLIGNGNSKIHPETFFFKTAASPHAAAAVESVVINLNDFIIPAHKKDLIIEGAGGLMVPLNDHEFVTDLIRKLDVPVILVSRNTLGSINFSLLTAMACKQKNIPVIGWIFNDNYLNYEKDIVKWSGIPSLASIPFSPHTDSAFIAEQAAKIRKNMEAWPW